MKTSNDELVDCACGCGEKRRRFDSCGNERKFISGHNDHWAKHRKAKFRTCPTCKTKFKPRRGITKKGGGKQRFCTLKCWMASPEWRSFVGSKRVPDDAPMSRSHLSVRALKRDDHKCRICGFNVVVEVHHIVPVHKGGGNVLANVVTLCPNHHAMADRNLIDREALFALVAR